MAIVLHIELDGIQPAIWREIYVPSYIALDELHLVIQATMPWMDAHLYEYKIGENTYTDTEIIEEVEENVLDARDQPLSKLVKRGDSFTYIYDFGDNWEHIISVKSAKRDKKDPYNLIIPYCIAGERAAPPEDCGGSYSYPEFVEALKDPKHPEHKQYKEWSDDFQPEIFSRSQANAHMASSYLTCLRAKGLI